MVAGVDAPVAARKAVEIAVERWREAVGVAAVTEGGSGLTLGVVDDGAERGGVERARPFASDEARQDELAVAVGAAARPSIIGVADVQYVADPRVGGVAYGFVPRRRHEGGRHRVFIARVSERLHEWAELAVHVAVREEGGII